MSRMVVFFLCAIVAGQDSFIFDLIISFHPSLFPAGIAAAAEEQKQDAALVDTAETSNLFRREASFGRKNGKKHTTRKSNACKCKKGDKQCKKNCRRMKRNKNNKILGKRDVKKANKKGGKGKGKRKSYKKETRQSNFQSCFSKLFKYTSKLKKTRNIQNQAKRINGTKDQMKGKMDKKVDLLRY